VIANIANSIEICSWDLDPSSNSHDAREAREVWLEIEEEDGNVDEK